MKFKPSILCLIFTGLTAEFHPATAQFSAPAPNVSWGATYTPGNYWTGNAPHDSGANSVDPTIAAGPDRLVLAYESSLDQFYDPAHGDDNLNNHYDAFNVVLGPSLPAPQDGFITSQPQVLIDSACPDGLGGTHTCYILLGQSLRSSDHSAEIAIAASSWTGQQEYGTWNSAAFDVSQNHSLYPARIRAGSTSNAVIVAADMYDWGTKSFQFSEVWIIPKAGLYPAGGQRPSYRYFAVLNNADGRPAQEVVPAASYVDSPVGYLLNAYKPASGGTENRITVWTIDTTDLSNPKLSGSTLTVDPYEEPPTAAQAGTDVRITTWDEAITSAVLQTNGLWAAQTTGCTFDGDSTERSCVRWYQLDATGSAILQQSTNGWSGAWVYYPSIAANSRGEATILFNASSENFDVGLYYMGRRSGDPSGAPSQIATLRAGNACFVRPNGSYYTVGGNTAVSLDLSDNESFWLFGAVATGNSQDCQSNHWGTWLGRITWAASAPSSSPQAVSAATFASGPVAPGSLISIFGTNLASGTQAAASVPLTTNLAGISVSANGVALPLLFVSPTQINAQLPFEITDTATLTVTANGVAGAPFRVNVANAAPGIFQFSGTRAVATNSDYSLNTSSNPAQTGSFITVYITGQGPFDNSIADGAGAPSSPLSKTSATTTASIGGKTATVLFSGATPGLVGVSQVNVVVPNGIPDGDNSLVITIGGVSSNSTTISVRN